MSDETKQNRRKKSIRNEFDVRLGLKNKTQSKKTEVSEFGHVTRNKTRPPSKSIKRRVRCSARSKRKQNPKQNTEVSLYFDCDFRFRFRFRYSSSISITIAKLEIDVRFRFRFPISISISILDLHV